MIIIIIIKENCVLIFYLWMSVSVWNRQMCRDWPTCRSRTVIHVGLLQVVDLCRLVAVDEPFYFNTYVSICSTSVLLSETRFVVFLWGTWPLTGAGSKSGFFGQEGVGRQVESGRTSCVLVLFLIRTCFSICFFTSILVAVKLVLTSLSCLCIRVRVVTASMFLHWWMLTSSIDTCSTSSLAIFL